jgi:hypothetical protein
MMQTIESTPTIQTRPDLFFDVPSKPGVYVVLDLLGMPASVILVETSGAWRGWMLLPIRLMDDAM